MLINIDKRISPQLLFILAQMGHGDEIAVVDANFPAVSTAAHCITKEPIDMMGVDAPKCIELITKLMPLDTFTEFGILRMEIDGAPNELGDVHKDVVTVLDHVSGDVGQGSIERQIFYKRSKAAFAVVQVSEIRPFGCFLLRKGVIF
jgi:L-fucose mutarotase